MPTRNVVLTDRHEALIGRLLESGQYQNASEILRDGLRLLEAREARAAEEAAKLEALKAAVQVGLDDIARGAFKEFANFDEFGSYLKQLTEEVIGRAARK